MKETTVHDSVFAASAKELKSMKTLAVSAMLIAVAVVLGFYTVQFTDTIRVGFSFLANELGALMFGPVAGGMISGIADIIKYLLKPTGPFFFGFTFDAILGGVIYGMMLYKKPVSLKRILTAKIVVAMVVNLFFNTMWLSMLYGNGFMAMLPARAVKQVIMVPLEAVLLYAVAKALSKAKILQAVHVHL